MKFVLVTGFLLMLCKFLAFYLTGSNAILTDAVESIVNVLAGGFALYSLYYAAKPRDKDHPYGHGKIEFLSTGVEGGMITIAGLAMMVKGVVALLHPKPLDQVNVGLIISVFAGLVNFILARLLIRKGKALHSVTMTADGRHLLTDTWTSAGLVLGLALIYFTGLIWIDSLITLILGIVIIYTGIKLIRESIFNLLDTADYSKISHLISVLNDHRQQSWIDIHNLRVVKYGAVVHVDTHMTLPWYFSLEEAHREVSAVSELASKEMNYEVEFFIHADPCLPKCCSVCIMAHCKVRQETLVKKLEWKIENVLPDAKHTMSEGRF